MDSVANRFCCTLLIIVLPDPNVTVAAWDKTTMAFLVRKTDSEEIAQLDHDTICARHVLSPSMVMIESRSSVGWVWEDATVANIRNQTVQRDAKYTEPAPLSGHLLCVTGSSDSAALLSICYSFRHFRWRQTLPFGCKFLLLRLSSLELRA